MDNMSIRSRMMRKNFFMSVELARRADKVAGSLGIDFSQLTREAINQFVEKAERQALDRELAAACADYREFNKKFSSDWSAYETEAE